jgi:hypothetical protein
MLSNNPLKRPFPDREFSRETIVGIARVSVFIFAALYLLRPYGIHFPGNPLLISLGYALVTFMVGVAYSYVTTVSLGWKKSGDGWTLGKWILDAALLLFCIAIANFLYYNATVGWRAFSFIVLISVGIPTVLVGLFPIALSGMAVQMRAERENQRTAGQLQLATAKSTTGRKPSLVSLGEGDFQIDPASLVFCESRQNYVRCVYLKEGKVTEETIRATLSSIEEKVSSPHLIRCHRSYLINPEHIRQARGNAQGLKLEVIGAKEEVPVSRAYVPALRELVLG